MDEAQPHGLLLHLAWVRWWSALAYHALAMAQGLERIGIPSRVVAPVRSPLAVRAAALGLDAPEWAGLGSRRPDRVLSAMRALRSAGRRGAVAGFFCHTGIGHPPAALALRGGPAPLFRVRADIRRPSGGLLQRWLYSRATDKVLISGDFMREGWFDGLRLEPGRIVTVPAGMDPRQAEGIDRAAARGRLRAELGWPPDARVVGMLARYSPVKGHADLIEAARLLAPRWDELRFVTAGPPGQLGREGAAALVRRAGLGHRFACLDAAEEPLAFAAGLDIAVVASRGSEAVCRSGLEYMALGLPVVATRVHVIPETIGEAGLIVPPADPPALADAIDRLLREPERARSLGREAARRVRSEFDPAILARRLAGLVEEARKERARHG